MNNVILSTKYPQFAEKLRQLGYHVISSKVLPNLISYEQDHADMQCLILDNTAFVLKECTSLAAKLERYYRVILTEEDIGGAYPTNVRLNAAVIGKAVVARLDSLDKNVKQYCIDHGYKLINVKQGYAKCSCAIVSDSALITADKGIYNSLKETNIEILLIQQGRVELQGADYGFIGGASGLDNNKRILYFAGNIHAHPDYQRIKAFCERHHTDTMSLSEDDLTDIGGMLFC